ncbi:MAG: hypothetical protein E6R03_02590 [Hyphomicrobiaceae bacterium]|jgi:hypothetical protein|nr:MAG: hypothetical protein E6R03_02590 [Hyphomicrobiaceae bacterium]
MFRVEIDDDAVLEAAERATELLRGVPGAFARAGRDAATRSRQEHLYRNRTGQAQANTRSVTDTSGDTVYTLVEIGVPYASYLRDRPVDLTAIDGSVETMKAEIDYYLAGLSDELTRL